MWGRVHSITMLEDNRQIFNHVTREAILWNISNTSEVVKRKCLIETYLRSHDLYPDGSVLMMFYKWGFYVIFAKSGYDTRMHRIKLSIVTYYVSWKFEGRSNGIVQPNLLLVYNVPNVRDIIKREIVP